jgi:hypothetical protein
MCTPAPFFGERKTISTMSSLMMLCPFTPRRYSFLKGFIVSVYCWNKRNFHTKKACKKTSQNVCRD